MAHFKELVILFSKISLQHHWFFKSDGLLNSKLFSTNFRCNIFSSTNTMEFVTPIFQSLFEDTTIATNFLKSHICSTFCIEIHTWFATFNKKELRNFKVRLTHSILQGIDHGKWKVFSSINAMKLVTQNYLFRKSNSSQEIPPPKKIFFWKSSYTEEPHALEKYMF